jgi:glycosyltransferase involved in cell wall biosynthesis
MPATAPRKKLLLLITNYGPGGAQRAFYDHSIFLRQQYDVSEAVFNKDELPNLYESGNPVYSLDVQGGSGIKGKIDNFRQRCRKLSNIIAKEKIDLCISHMDGANWVNVLSKSRAKKILFVQGTVIHDYAISNWLRILRKKLIIPYLYNKAALTVAVADGIKYELEHYCGVKRVVTIPNFFDTAAIQEKAAIPLSAEWEEVFAGSEILITSGRLHIQKKQRYLLPLLKKLVAQRPNLKLIILGDGDLRNELIEEAGNIGLRVYSGWNKEQPLSADYDLYFPGYISNPFQFLKRSTLFVFPSGWEGFPLALCEAMISGVPAIAADCPTGPREIMMPGTFDPQYTLRKKEESTYGYLMPMVDKPEFEATWLDAINELLDNPEKRVALIKSGQERMKEYDKSVATEKWFAVIERVLGS